MATAAQPSVSTEHSSGGRASGRSPLAGAQNRRTIGRALAVLAVLACIGALFTDAQAIQAVLLGLGSGALIAALGLGVVVTYRGSGVVNVATGAMAMYSSYIFNALNSEGNLLLLGWTVHIGSPWAFGPALIATLVLSGIWALIFYRLIFFPLRYASPVAKVVASVGLLIALQAIVVLKYSSLPAPVKATLSNSSVKLPSHIDVPVNQLILTGVVVVIAFVLGAIYKFSLFGLATRAAAEDERHLSLLGRSPRLVSGGNWVFSGMVVALFAVLISPINGTVDPTTDVLLVIPALAAALIGRFSSFGWAAAGGLVIGMAQALVQYLSTKAWWPRTDGQPLPGVAEAIPFVIILLALATQRRGLGSRGTLGNVRLPFSPDPRHVLRKLIGCGAIGVVGFLVLSSEWRLAEINTLVGIAICLSLVILTGFVGQVSLAQMAFAGFSGFVLSKLSSGAGIGFPFAPLIGALCAAFLGVLIAFPALRIRGVQLAVATLAAGVVVVAMVFDNPFFDGVLQSATVPPPRLFGLKFGPIDPSSLGDGKIPDPWFGIFCVIVVMLIALLTTSVRSSAWGRRMLAVRANERAAAASGISIRTTKIVTFGLAAFVAGIGGALSGYRFGTVTPEYFGVLASLTFLAFAYMGGISSVTGAVIGGLLVTNGLMFTALQKWIGVSPNYSVLVGGLGLIVTVVANPEGIAGAFRVILARWSFGRRLLGAPAKAAGEGEESGSAIGTLSAGGVR